MARFRRRLFARRLLHHVGDLECLALARADADDAVHVHTFRRHFLDRDDIGVVAQLARGIDHLLEATGPMQHQHVGEQNSERLIADEVAGAPHRMAQPERRLLAGKARRARRKEDGADSSSSSAFLPRSLERLLELGLAVEIVLDRRPCSGR